MITYERYANIRDGKGLKDADVAKLAGIQQSVLSDWKRGKSTPKMDKLVGIADVLEIDYFALVGPVGKFSSYNPNKPVPHLYGMMPGEISDFDKELIRLYNNATPDAQSAVMTLLKNSQKEDSNSLKEA